MSNTTYHDMPQNLTEVNEFTEYQVGLSLWIYVAPVLITLGTVGNVITIVVLSRSSMRHSTTSLYLRVLAVVDVIVLNTGLMRQWLAYLIDKDIRWMTEIGCKIHTWMVYFSVHASAWLLVAVTLERVLSVMFPHTVKLRCTRKAAYAIISTILVFFLLLNAHYLYGLGDAYEESDNKTVLIPCDGLTTGYLYFERAVWPWIDLTFYSTLPSSILIISNFCIIKKVFNSNRKIGVKGIHGDVEVRKRNMSSMTMTLVVVSATYVICTTPFCLYIIYTNIFAVDHSQRTEAVMSLLWALVNLLQYTNNAVNFILYCVTGTRFRQELKTLVCKKKTHRQPITISTTRNSLWTHSTSL